MKKLALGLLVLSSVSALASPEVALQGEKAQRMVRALSSVDLPKQKLADGGHKIVALYASCRGDLCVMNDYTDTKEFLMHDRYAALLSAQLAAAGVTAETVDGKTQYRTMGVECVVPAQGDATCIVKPLL